MIHATKVVPNIYIPFYNYRMKDGEVYAIETFPTTGTGNLKDGTDISHYMINYKPFSIPTTPHKKTFTKIFDVRKTLAWHSDWFNDYQKEDPNFQKDLKKLIKDDYIKEYPPLLDIDGSFVAQTEHTIGIRENGVLVYS